MGESIHMKLIFYEIQESRLQISISELCINLDFKGYSGLVLDFKDLQTLYVKKIT